MFYNEILTTHVVRKFLDDLRNSKKYYHDSAAVAVQSLSINTPHPNLVQCITKMALSSLRQDMKVRSRKNLIGTIAHSSISIMQE